MTNSTRAELGRVRDALGAIEEARGVADGKVGTAGGKVGAAEGEGGVTRGQVVCREERGCRVESLKSGSAGSLLTQVFSRVRAARLLSSEPSSCRSKRIKNDIA